MKKIALLSIVALLVAAQLTSCRKKEDTIARVTVRDASGSFVSGAQVRLYPEASESTGGEIQEEWENFVTTTNSSGVAEFNFNEIYELGQAGVAVANIEAAKGGETGTGVIKVEQETITEETVYI